MAENQLIPVAPKELLVINNNTSVTVPILYERTANSHYSFTRRITENCTVRMDEYDQDIHSNDIESDFDDSVPEAKKSYYLMAAASGVLSASLSFMTLTEIQEEFEKKEPNFGEIGRKTVSDRLVK